MLELIKLKLETWLEDRTDELMTEDDIDELLNEDDEDDEGQFQETYV